VTPDEACDGLTPAHLAQLYEDGERTERALAAERERTARYRWWRDNPTGNRARYDALVEESTRLVAASPPPPELDR